jgi:hypothetical protein
VGFRKFTTTTSDPIVLAGDLDIGARKNVVLPWSGTVTIESGKVINNAGNIYLHSTASLEGGTVKGAGTFYVGSTISATGLSLVAPSTGITGTAFYDDATALGSDIATLPFTAITGTGGPGAVTWAASSGGVISAFTSEFEPAGPLTKDGLSVSTITDLALTTNGTNLIISGTASGLIITGSSELIDFGTSALKNGGVKSKPLTISGTVETD